MSHTSHYSSHNPGVDDRSGRFRYQETNHYYFLNHWASVDRDSIDGYKYQTRHSPSYNAVGDERRGIFNSQDTKHYSFLNQESIFDGDCRGWYRSQTSHYPSHNPCGNDRLILVVFLPSHHPSHNHVVQYSVPPGYSQDAFPWGGGVKTMQFFYQYCNFYPHQNHTYYLYPIIYQQPYPSMPPHPICSCIYCTSSPIYENFMGLHTILI